MRHIHALTPGDHYSPRTGSAIPTVVHGLSSHARERPAVLVARGTYAERYGSADVIEYPMTRSLHGASRALRLFDAALGRAGRPRPWARSVLRQVLVEQDCWNPGHVVAHNAPQLIPLISHRHAPVLHVHNGDLLRSYSRREAARVLERVHRIICVSEWVAKRTRAHVPPGLHDRIRVVPNGVDASHLAHHPRVPRHGPLRVAFVGRTAHSFRA